MERDDQTTVLHLITYFATGGAETTVHNEIEALLESDGEYDILLGTGSGYDTEELDKIKDLGVEVAVFRTMRHYNPFTAPLAVIAVAIFLRQNEVDIVHTHSTEAGVIGRLGAAMAGTDTVVHEIHGDPITNDRNQVLNKCLCLAEKLCARFSDRIVAKSDRIADIYLERGIGCPEQYCMIRHGIDVEPFEKAPQNDKYYDKTTILFAGRLSQGKGLYDLCEAAANIEHREIQILIAGTGAMAHDLQTYLENNDLDNISLLGFRDDIPELMASVDALVLPSYREGTPRVITEAKASELPVISTRIAGIPEQIKDGKSGQLIGPGDISALKRAIEDVHCNPEKWEKMGINASEDIKEYRMENVQELWRSHYSDWKSTER